MQQQQQQNNTNNNNNTKRLEKTLNNVYVKSPPAWKNPVLYVSALGSSNQPHRTTTGVGHHAHSPSGAEPITRTAQ